MDKYRVRLQSGRIVGPFNLEQVAELYSKGHITGPEECQVFPIGDWRPFFSFGEFKSFLNSESSSEDKTSFRIDIAKKAKSLQEQQERIDEIKQEGVHEFKEFKVDLNKKMNIAPDYKKLEEEFKKEEEKRRNKNIEQEKEEEEENNKTRIIKKNKIQSHEDVDIQKTRVLNAKELLKEEDDSLKKPEPVLTANIVPIVDSEMKTQVVRLEEFLPEIKGKTVETEKEMAQKELELIEDEKKKQILEEEQKRKEEAKNQEEEKVESKTKNKKIKPIVAFAFLALIYFFMFDDDDGPKEIIPRAISIEFPMIGDVEDQVQSLAHLKKGHEYYAKENYENKIYAESEFKKSLSYQFVDNEALGHLILAQAELYPNSVDKIKSSNTISKLMQIAYSRSLTDLSVVLGSAIFYSHFEKYSTAVNTIENYLRGKHPASLKLYSYYLKFLIKKGDIEKARKTFEKLRQEKNQSIESILSMVAFLELDQRFPEAETFLENASKINSNSVPLLLEYSKYTLRNQDYKKLLKTLNAIRALNAEFCPVYYSKYLEYMGILSVLNKDNKQAAILFKQALLINDSDELRSKLASLEVGGGKAAEELILESKAVELMSKARLEMEYKNWEDAFKHALEASDLSPSYIPAQLLLAEVEIKRGYFSSALEKLELLISKYPVNKKVNFAKAEALMASYKYDDAKNFLGILNGSPDFKDTSEMASLMARYYDSSNSFNLAGKWYAESINRNPVDDLEYFRFSKFYLKFKKFAKSKDLILKAIALSPETVEYHCLYAEILYELESVETALGYLRNLGSEIKDEPKVLGEIAKYYYKSGQAKFFEETKIKIEQSLKRDPDFYEFLIDASRKEDKVEDVVKYSQELIKIKPGELGPRMVLANFYFDKGDYQKSLKTLEEIKNRLDSYPKLNYHLCKIYLELKDLDKALKAAQDEIKFNPSLENGYVMEGEVYKAMEDYAKAEKSFVKAISANPNASGPLSALGWLKYKQGHHEAARELYVRAINEDPNDPLLHLQVGKIYKSIGQSTLAIEAFQVYLKLAPEGKDKAEVEQLIRSLK